MGWDGVPWGVEGGAIHSANVARLNTYLATGGKEGVVNPTDLRVMALATPGTSIRAMSGACVIRNRALGGTNESYAARMPSEDVVAVTATGAGSGRSDLVVANVENPNISGEPWGTPASIEDGPYIFTRIISGVSATTKSVHELSAPWNGWTAITLARLDIPASTGTVTQAMIKDLRTVANPTGAQPAPDADGGGEGEEGDCVIHCPSQGNDSAGDVCSYTATGFIDWPAHASFDYHIPSWATHLDITIEVQNCQLNNAHLRGEIRLLIAGIEQMLRPWSFNWPGGAIRQHIPIVHRNHPIAAALRGTTQTWKVQTRCIPGYFGFLRANDVTNTKVTLRFKSKPSYD